MFAVIKRFGLVLLLALVPAPLLAQTATPAAPAATAPADEVLRVRFAPPLDQPIRYSLTFDEIDEGRPVKMVATQELRFVRNGDGYLMSIRWLTLSIGGQTFDMTAKDLPIPPTVMLLFQPLTLELNSRGEILRVRDWDKLRKDLIASAPGFAKMMATNPAEQQDITDFFAAFLTKFTAVPAESAPSLMVQGWPQMLGLIALEGRSGQTLASRRPVQTPYRTEPVDYDFQTRFSRPADGKGVRILAIGRPDAANARKIEEGLIDAALSSLPESKKVDRADLARLLADPDLVQDLDVTFDGDTGLPVRARLLNREKFKLLDNSSTLTVERQ